MVSSLSSCSMWDLVPWPGIKPRPSAVGVQSLSHWTTREVPTFPFLSFKKWSLSWAAFKKIIVFIYLGLFWVFVALHRLSLVVANGWRAYSSLQCMGFSLQRLLLLWSMGSRHVGFRSCSTWAQKLRLEGSRVWMGSVVMVHRLSYSAACGIFPDQGSNLCPLLWQADSYSLCH